MTNQEFIQKIGAAAVKYYDQYKILPSLTIAQAILESAWGKSGLAIECHNYFGMKWVDGCGCNYKAYQTKEQRSNGVYYTIVAKFRKYDSIEAGIKGYYEFLKYPRYKNLIGVTDYKKACELIRSDGWATSLSYTQNLIKLIETYKLADFDQKVLSKVSDGKNKNNSKNNDKSDGKNKSDNKNNGKKYFKKYTGKSVSIVDALCAIKEKSSFDFRSKIAKANGIKNYQGSVDQNTHLLKLLKQGKLLKP